ncbi:serine/threonine-protein phosphatase [Bacillus sp. Bva_UNVM-123]|uniref:PP2C family protein-serine/threonine phosphatase n=1 Tax=Bacillus sp. Bva_UNVM-123 TaxID=2829798 RepID=UPI00391FAC04
MSYAYTASFCFLLLLMSITIFAPLVMIQIKGSINMNKIETMLHTLSLWESLLIFTFIIFISMFIYQKVSKQKITKNDLSHSHVTNKSKPIENSKRRIVTGNAQHIGWRLEQQDTVGFSNLHDEAFIYQFGALAVLADGIGHLLRGKDVSQIAVQTFIEHYLHTPYIHTIPEKLASSVEAANDAVLHFARENGLEGRVGTTIAAAVVYKANLYWLSVGDSRIYLCQESSITQLTTDHIYAKELDEKAANGSITFEEAINDPQRENIVSYLGIERLEEIDISLEPIHLNKGESILLCSDGLYQSITIDEILMTFRSFPTQDAAERLIEIALSKQKPNQDNVTAVIFSI